MSQRTATALPAASTKQRACEWLITVVQFHPHPQLLPAGCSHVAGVLYAAQAQQLVVTASFLLGMLSLQAMPGDTANCCCCAIVKHEHYQKPIYTCPTLQDSYAYLDIDSTVPQAAAQHRCQSCQVWPQMICAVAR